MVADDELGCPQWLLAEALANNPKIEMNVEGKYLFKAPYKIKDKKGLLKLLKQQDLKGLGGIMLEDVQESLPHCEKALKVSLTDSPDSTLTYLTLDQGQEEVVVAAKVTRPEGFGRHHSGVCAGISTSL